MQNSSSGLNYINSFPKIPKNPVIEKKPGIFSSIVLNTMTIGKMILGRNLNICLPNLQEGIWKNIFSKLDFKSLYQCSLVSHEYNQLVHNPILTKQMIYEGFSFNPLHWNQVFGKGTVSCLEPEKAFRLLPADIDEILKKPCPIYAQKRIIDTHMLVWIPENIKNKNLTIKSFGKLLKQKLEFYENKAGYRIIWKEVLQQETFEIRSGWVLMTKDIIPGSENQSYERVQEMLLNINQSNKMDYRLPKTIEAIVCIMTHYFRTKKRLFSMGPFSYLLCHENINSVQAVVGGFMPNGLFVFCNYGHNTNLSIAALHNL